MKNSPYFPVVKLLLRCLPEVAKETAFALKGGTAINLFVRDFPRLSVDIDLTYLGLEDHDEATKSVAAGLTRMAKSIRKAIPTANIQEAKDKAGNVHKLMVTNEGHQIKIDAPPVMRGSVYGTEKRKLSKKAEDLFEMSATIESLKLADLYGGKLCAAMDRQHPRDLFDVKLLLENEGITKEIRRAFVVYVASHKRPINELLNPNLKDIAKTYKSEFQGMAEPEVELEALLKTRDQFIAILKKDLVEEERRFLLSIKECAPNWELLGIPGLEKLPAILWKLTNLEQLKKKNKAKHQEQVDRLKKVLSL